MEVLRDNHGPLIVLKQLRFLRIQLEGRPETAELHREIEEHFKALSDAVEREDDAATAVTAQTQKLEHADGLLDRKVLDAFEQELQALVGKDRRDPRYLRFFGERTVSAVKRLPYERECETIESFARLLAAPELKELADWPEKMLQGVAEVRRRLAERARLNAEHASVFNELMVVTEEARRAYNQMEEELSLIFGPDKEALQCFFRPMRTKAATEPDLFESDTRPIFARAIP